MFKCDICRSNEVNTSIMVQNLKVSFCQDCLVKIRDVDSFEHDLLVKLLSDNFGRQTGSMFSDMISKSVGNVPGFNRTQRSIQGNDDSSFLIDLTKEFQSTDSPILFRDKELNRVIQILSRKTKNNPVIIGEPGVGKTAIVELLANKIANNEIEKFANHKVLELNIAAMMAGTKYRGELEKKFNDMINNVKGDVILFVDEMHLLMGAGSSSDSDIDISNLLKPYLSRGKIKLIGATTLDEFRSIEKDKAFARRVQPVHVKEINKDNTKVLMSIIKVAYEKHHNVSIDNDMINLIVDLSDEYIKDRYFPDKAIDVLDESMSKVSVSVPGNKQTISPEEIKVKTLAHIGGYEDQYLLDSMESMFDDALEKYQNSLPKITKDIILETIESISGVPVSNLNKEKIQKIKDLEKNLNSKIVGQDDAVDGLIRASKRVLVKVRKDNKPKVFFFSGPTGVGKTESAKVLTKSLFGKEDAMIRLDMSEYMESHTISKLIGSPPGYVGHEDAGQLTEAVRRNPFSVVLLDEFEKAHPQVSKLFLQVFDDGILTDSKGRKVDFSNTIIIMTSNIGTQKTLNTKPLGFSSVDANEVNKDKVLDAIKGHYAPEFINRIDEIVTFNELSEDDLSEISDLLLAKFVEDVSENLNVTVSDSVKKSLINESYDYANGARPLKRSIERNLEDTIIDYMIYENNNDENEEVNIHIDLIDGEYVALAK